jgi:hypothetical protein
MTQERDGALGSGPKSLPKLEGAIYQSLSVRRMVAAFAAIYTSARTDALTMVRKTRFTFLNLIVLFAGLDK